jgi:hypothetical protein
MEMEPLVTFAVELLTFTSPFGFGSKAEDVEIVRRYRTELIPKPTYSCAFNSTPRMIYPQSTVAQSCAEVEEML